MFGCDLFAILDLLVRCDLSSLCRSWYPGSKSENLEAGVLERPSTCFSDDPDQTSRPDTDSVTFCLFTFTHLRRPCGAQGTPPDRLLLEDTRRWTLASYPRRLERLERLGEYCHDSCHYLNSSGIIRVTTRSVPPFCPQQQELLWPSLLTCMPTGSDSELSQ